jgi:hypothetical protein
MNLNIEHFHFVEWGLRMGWFEGQNGDMDLMLWQGDCPGCGDDCYVRLSPCHFEPLARELGLLREEEVDQRVGRMQDRLTLLAALVRAHSPAGSPLRTAVDALLGSGSETHPVEAPPKPLRSTPGSGEPTSAPDAARDLFAGATATSAT